MKPIIATLLALLFMNTPLQAEEELLPADEAFALAVEAIDGQTVRASWTIADGYYLYRSKFRFESGSEGITLGETQLPAGKIKHDEFFGDVEIYRGTLSAMIPVQSVSGVNTLNLKIVSQGCADLGVCYPPQKTQHEITLPTTTAKPAFLSGAEDTLGGMDDDILDVDEAFRFGSLVLDGNTLLARWEIAPNHYLYKDKFSFELSGGDHVTLGKPRLPRGEEKDDEFFGRIEVYHDVVEVELPLQRGNPEPTSVTLKVGYQGCAEAGICYPPTKKTSMLSLPPLSEQPPAVAAASIEPPAAPVDTGTKVSTADVIGAILLAFAVGFGLTFTPCVLPMIPILSSIIVGQSSEKASPMRGGMLSAIYVLGTAVTYTAVGVLAGATGDQLQAYFQNPWAIGTFATILVLLALSMFGFYEIQMPSFIQTRLQEKSQNLKGGTAIGVFIMGLISAAIVGACVSPGLISVLGIAMQSRDPVLGGAIMFSMALGMGIVLIAIGFGMGGLVPRAGAWMDKVKYTFGVLLLGVAIYLLGILPQVPVLYLWAVLFIVSGVYMGATQAVPDGASRWSYLWKGIGTLLIIWGLFALLGAFAGNRDILRPIQFGADTMPVGFSSTPIGEESVTHTELFQRVASIDELKSKMAEARAAGKPVVIDFYADWCTDCVRMEKSTFTDPRVRQLLDGFVALQIDVSENDENDLALKRHLNVFGPPAMLLYTANGKALSRYNFYGYKTADEFLQHMNSAYPGR